MQLFGIDNYNIFYKYKIQINSKSINENKVIIFHETSGTGLIQIYTQDSKISLSFNFNKEFKTIKKYLLGRILIKYYINNAYLF